jgi:hypothetical protein
MDGKIKSYQDLLASWNKLTGSAPRQTALDSEGLNYIGRPMDQLSEEQKEEMFAPQEDRLALEAIAAEQPQAVQEESVEKPLEEPTPLALNDIMNEPEQIALDKISTLPQEAPKKSREEELMDQYLKEKDLYDKSLENAYAAERRSEIAQNVIEGLGKAFIYNKYARVAPPMPINIKPMDMKYVEEAKEKGKNKLDTYKELLAQLKTNKEKGLNSFRETVDGKKYLYTQNDKGEVVSKVELGNVGVNKDKPIKIGNQLIKLNDDNSVEVIYNAPNEDKTNRENSKAADSLNSMWLKGDITKKSLDVSSAHEKVMMNKDAKTPQSDMSLLYGYIKMLDPGSAVKEGEYAAAEDTKGIPEKVVTLYNNAKNGIILSDKQRENFIKEAETLLRGQLVAQKRFDNAIKERARQRGLEPDSVVYGDILFGDVYNSDNKQEKKPQSAPVKKVVAHEQDEAAIKWAKENPDNEMAKQILKENGL